jgi:peptide deformylase
VPAERGDVDRITATVRWTAWRRSRDGRHQPAPASRRIVYDVHVTVRPTVLVGNPALRSPCSSVAKVRAAGTRRIAQDLQDTLEDWNQRAGYGRGIAAPQIGEPIRMIHLRFGDHPILVNPRITTVSEETWMAWEGCLSFSLAFFCQARRYVSVDYEFETLDGKLRQSRATGALAHLLQHEIDHLDGRLAVDRMEDVSTMCVRSEFERRFRGESPYASD